MPRRLDLSKLGHAGKRADFSEPAFADAHAFSCLRGPTQFVSKKCYAAFAIPTPRESVDAATNRKHTQAHPRPDSRPAFAATSCAFSLSSAVARVSASVARCSAAWTMFFFPLSQQVNGTHFTPYCAAAGASQRRLESGTSLKSVLLLLVTP